MSALRVHRHVQWSEKAEGHAEALGRDVHDDPVFMAVEFYLGTDELLSDSAPVPNAVDENGQVYAYRTKPFAGKPVTVYFQLLTPPSGSTMQTPMIVGVMSPVK